MRVFEKERFYVMVFVTATLLYRTIVHIPLLLSLSNMGLFLYFSFFGLAATLLGLFVYRGVLGSCLTLGGVFTVLHAGWYYPFNMGDGLKFGLAFMVLALLSYATYELIGKGKDESDEK